MNGSKESVSSRKKKKKIEKVNSCLISRGYSMGREGRNRKLCKGAINVVKG